MPSIQEQISSAAQTQLTNQLAVINALSNTAFGNFQKLVALNLTTARQTLESSAAVARQLLASNDAQQLLSLTVAQSQPQFEHILAYGRELANISGDARSQFLEAVSVPPNTVAASLKPVALANQSAAHSGDVQTKALQTTVPATIGSKVSAPLAAAISPSALVAAPIVAPTAQADIASQAQLPLLTEAPKKAAKAFATPKPVVAAFAPESAALKSANLAALSKPAAPVKPTVVTQVPSTKAVAKPALVTGKETAASKTPAIDKPALKSTFPASPIKQAVKPPVAKPAFPNAGATPAFKDKSSAATSAKKPVRQ